MTARVHLRPTHRGGKPHRTCTRDPQLDVSWDRRSDRDDCANYDACRNAAAVKNQRTVCTLPCGNFTPKAKESASA